MQFTKQQILDLQQSWANGIMAIGQALNSDDNYIELGKQFVEDHYLIDDKQPLLFKPTCAKDIPFRNTLAGACAYFVSGDTNFPEDTGFALKQWIEIKFMNNQIMLLDNIAIAMGEYILTAKDGNTVKAEYTLGYKYDAANKAKIFLHHSSVPYGQ